jgi:aspartate/methionine/tyrosine aminotransferase
MQQSPAPATVNRERFRSDRIAHFGESVIREMTRLAIKHGAVNLAQGFPDFPAPSDIKQAACDAILADVNQYSITWGAKVFRDAIAEKYRQTYGLDFDPEREISVCCGSTEGMIATLLATTNPGDEIVVFEPFYENYHPDTLLCSATRRLVRMHPPDWTFDPAELSAAFSSRTKAIIVNTPHNPTGKVFSRAELELIAGLCQKYDALCFTDEIYEHIVYDGAQHIPMISLPGMRDRTVLVNSISKTYSVTGWRVGWVLAAPDLTDSIRKVHDFLTVGAAHPLQQAGAMALLKSPEYYQQLAAEYRTRRDILIAVLKETGLKPYVPRAAYYVMADIAGLGFDNDIRFCRYLLEDIGVAAVPGSSFYERSMSPGKSVEESRDGFGNSVNSSLIRFCFCKNYETLKAARNRLVRLRSN